MPDKKELSEIRPAKGAVKVKRNLNPDQENIYTRKKKEKPQIVQNVKSNEKIEESVPTEEAMNLSFKLNVANKEFMEAMRAFNRLLNDQTLQENKSIKDKELEQSVVNRLASSAITVENLSPIQGLLGLCILSIRQTLSLRDAGNFLAHKLHEAEERIAKLEIMVEKSNQTPDDTKKEYLKELAKEMGIKITLE